MLTREENRLSEVKHKPQGLTSAQQGSVLNIKSTLRLGGSWADLNGVRGTVGSWSHVRPAAV